MDFSGKHVLVLGLGETGLAMAQWLLRCGARLRVADTRTAPDLLAILTSLSASIEFVGGEFTTSLLESIDVVAVSPGLSPLRELASLLPEAKQKNIPVWGEIELFAQALEALKAERNYTPKIIAITGTNGKTTVTSLVGQLCERAGLTTKLAGNISPAVLDVLREELEREELSHEGLECGSLPQVWVLELSSFQLHTTYSLNADVATVLNITQDHLDWHGDLAAYCTDKARIFGAQTLQVLNRDDALVMAMAKPDSNFITFGVNAPLQANDLGLLNEHGMTWLATAIPTEDAPVLSRRKKKEVIDIPVSMSRLMPVDALKIRGQHNAANVLAALALCRAIGLSFAPLLHGAREYQGEPHRVELVASIAGIDYVDDSKGTNVGATVAALKGLGQELLVSNDQQKRILLIAGGDGKGQDFSPLASVIAQYAKAVFLIGKDAGEIRNAAQISQVDMIDYASLELAVQAASEQAVEGDIVLLSPACASLDMFRNYAHRADVFIDAVKEIGLARGEIF
ncbi:UDP-N-acetylmuramoyl-L-alanine--D-glutamate ligase [Undibacterium sp. RTI2.1]|uniref:UDP-N-acetylmuramoyl-L-alanine--D-glutamate ligase n=1 Tax=unclassified Undibacterium TaxID=2630295 RepID=UPI002B23B568|nr:MULTISPECIES: UDP-N-acetylmuramoyl-L-alanine--D-glutamate ligase [unclassified Undibacterium]MEB0029961.1 UDP-N-acetylmuramoyl-L-alanine--D-glutamate ligase [Undibacterium sp. RTI2.1]MEB0117075.1 UDP-N-acetylmuramoyl-L-alanine--D-glutamate ligase [Undibacterium sp. RTI2.2]